MYTIKNTFLHIQKYFEPSRVWKTEQHEKVGCFQHFPFVYHLLNSGKWFGSYGPKTARQKQSEVQTDMPKKFNYFTQCISICDEGRNHDLVIF